MKKALCLITVIFLFTSGAASAMNMFFSEFQKKWDELSKDVDKLNEYTQTHPNIEMKNTKVEDINIDGVIFNGATFENVDFSGVSSRKSKYLKVRFVNCKFENYKAWNSEFVDVVFDNCEFISTNFLGSTVMNVKIEHCKGVGAEFDDLRGNELLVEDTILNDRSSFTDGRIPFVFRNTTLSGVNMMGLSGNNTLLIEGGLLDEVNFGKSHFSNVTLRRVKQGEGGIKFNGSTAKEFILEDVELDGIGFMDAKASLAVIRNSEVLAIGFTGGGVGKIVFSNSTVRYFDVAESVMPHVEFINCFLIEPMLYDGAITELSIRDSTISVLKGKRFKADTVVWDNVTLDGKIDFTNAQITDLQATRLKRGPNLNLITTGSNIKL